MTEELFEAGAQKQVPAEEVAGAVAGEAAGDGGFGRGTGVVPAPGIVAGPEVRSRADDGSGTGVVPGTGGGPWTGIRSGAGAGFTQLARESSGHERGNWTVAILLAAAAVAAALVGAHASMVSNDANDSWQTALRMEVKRSAGAMNDVHSLYQGDLPVAIDILRAKISAEKLQAAAPGQDPAVAKALTIEAGVQTEMLATLQSSSDLAGNAAYALPSGGYDLAQRLTDIRAESPDILALDPDVLEAAGDRLAHKALLLTDALVPLSLCAFLGVLAQPLRRFRRPLLGSGAVALAVGAIFALGVEVLA